MRNDSTLSRRGLAFHGLTSSALMLVGLAFALRLYRLGSVELWFDETASFAVASKGYREILDYVRQASAEHPPFYYFALHTWMKFVGSSEFVLRYFSLCLGVLLIAVLFRFARREFGNAIGLGVALVAAASPFMLVYSQEARMYTLVPLLGILAMELFLLAVRQGRLRDWVVLALVVIAGVGVHYYFTIILVGQGLFLLAQFGQANRRTLGQWLVMVSIPIVIVALWLVLSPGPMKYFPNLLASRFAPWNNSVERLVQDMVWGEPFGYDFPVLVRMLVVAAWFPLLFGLWAARPRLAFSRRSQSVSPQMPMWSPDRQAQLLCVSTLVGGFFSVIIAPQGVVGRHFAVMAPPFIILLTLGLAELNRRYPMLGSLAMAGVLLLFVVGLQNQLAVDKGDWGEALSALAQAAEPGDAIVLPYPTVWPILTYYHHRADIPVYYLPQVPDPNAVSLFSDPGPEVVDAFMADIAKKHRRIWVGLSDMETSDPWKLVPHWLARQDFALRADFHNTASFYLFAQGDQSTLSLPTRASFGESIQLLDAQANSLVFIPGQTLLFELDWQTKSPIKSDDLVITQLVDERGVSWAEQRILPCGGFCVTSDWPVNKPVPDRHGLLIPPGTPPGTYQLRLELYNPTIRASLPVTHNSVSLDLARIDILPDPDAPIPVTDHPVTVRFGPALRLMGFGPSGVSVRPGDRWPVDVIWGADGAIGEDLTAVFRWTDAHGLLLAETQMPIGTSAYTTAAWVPGFALRQHYDVPLPDNPPADIRAQLLVRGAGSEFLPIARPSGATRPLSRSYPSPGDSLEWAAQAPASFDLAVVRVTPPEHSFSRPDVQYPLAVQLSDKFAAIGITQPLPTRKTVDVAIYWQALDFAQTDYKVFVHLIDSNDQVVAQHDGAPANNFRPTSGWLPGEFILDQHRISFGTLPKGTYRIEIGMYDPHTNLRLPVLMNHAPQPDGKAVIGTVTLP